MRLIDHGNGNIHFEIYLLNTPKRFTKINCYI